MSKAGRVGANNSNILTVRHDFKPTPLEEIDDPDDERKNERSTFDYFLQLDGWHLFDLLCMACGYKPFDEMDHPSVKVWCDPLHRCASIDYKNCALKLYDTPQNYIAWVRRKKIPGFEIHRFFKDVPDSFFENKPPAISDEQPKVNKPPPAVLGRRNALREFIDKVDRELTIELGVLPAHKILLKHLETMVKESDNPLVMIDAEHITWKNIKSFNFIVPANSLDRSLIISLPLFLSVNI